MQTRPAWRRVASRHVTRVASRHVTRALQQRLLVPSHSPYCARVFFTQAEAAAEIIARY